MWQRFRSDPVRRLRERLDRFGAGHDPRHLLDAGAARDAEAVVDLVSATEPTAPLPERTAEALFLLACLHWYRYQVLPAGRDADDLAQAVTLTRLLLHAAPDRVPPSLLALYRAHAPAADPARVPRSRAPEAGRTVPADAPAALAMQAVLLMGDAERTGRYAAADRAEALLRRAIDVTPPGPERATYLSMLGRVHRDQFRHLGRSRALPAAIDAHRESLESTRADDAQRPTRLFNLGNVLSDRFEVDGDPATLDESRGLLREAAASATDPTVRALASGVLGQVLRHRWRIHGRPADLDEAVDAFGRARPAGDPRLAALHGIVLSERFLRDGSPADRDAGIDALRAAVGADTPLDAELAGPTWGGLAALLEDRYRADESAPAAGADLDAALDAYRAAAGATGDDGLRHQVGVLLTHRYERGGDAGDLAEAVRLLRAGVAAADDPVVRGRRLADLGYALARGRPEHGAVDAWRAACDALTEAVALLPPGDPARHRSLNNLGNSLRERADQGDDPDLLERAAEALRAAVAETDPRTPADYLSNLGLVLQARFAVTQDLATLAEAVAVLTDAVEAAPPGHPARAAALTNYGAALNRRAELAVDGTGPAAADAARRDTDAAVAALREAVALADPTDPQEYAQSGGSLATALFLRHRTTGDTAALDETIDLLDGLTRAGPLRPADRHRALTNLGNALLVRHRATAAAGDAGAMLAAYRGAVDALPPEHPDRTMCLSNLATALEATTAPGDAPDARARAALREAASVPAAPSSLRAVAAHRAARLADLADDLPAALDGYTAAIELLDLVAWHGMDPDDQARLLARFRGLATDAAAVAVALGDPRRAVEVLEYGRGVLLTRAHDATADLTALRAGAPDLAAAFSAVQTELDGFRPAGADTTPRPAGGPPPERRHALAERRRRLLAEIRALPGLDRFLRPPEFVHLAAGCGPVALVNVGERRSDALVVAAGDVTVVPLPEVTPAEVAARTAQFVVAVAVLTGQAPPVAEPAASRRVVAARAAVGRTLDWLWRAVAAPVLDVAAPPGEPGEWQRFWWCPTGLLTLLPLHAAAPLDGGPGVLDRVVPSYTASLRALDRARRAVPDVPTPVDRALVVSLPHTPGLPDLPGAAHEARIVRGHLPYGGTLSGASATADAVVAALPGQPLVHLSCHGRQDLGDPLAGHLALSGGPLRVRDLWRPSGGAAALAVLSACETAQGGAALPDEVLTLGTAFQLAGFRQVVGALWSISDPVTVQLCADLYDALAVPGGVDPDRAAVALHHAVRGLRAALPGRADLWAAYAHLGP
ncbi:CHAT domain-containing protein [Micromonospora sediminicola]|uniref:CHAT domain-containing protein n=1 Tax=Micromonospora sediminicola TaxID=946078 RepID=UPI00340140CA